MNPVPPEASGTMSVPEDTPLWTFQQGPLFFKWQRTLKPDTGDKSAAFVGFQVFFFLCSYLILLICIVKIKQAQSQLLGIQEEAEMMRESWQVSWEEPDQGKKWAKLMATIIWSDSLGGQSLGLERVMNFLASQETEDNITQNLLCSRMQFPPCSTDGSFSAVYIFLSTSSVKVLKTGKAAQNSKRSCANSFTGCWDKV